jgi:hypothetical protein
MSKSYKIKVNQGGGEAKFVDIPQLSGGGQPLAVKAVPGGKYQLVDTTTGYGPENIRASRSGQNLKVYFEGRSQPDLVIEDYYKETPEGFNGLIGESESSRFYEYIPETAAGNSAVPLLADGSNQVGMALGGSEINASGAAVGALVAAAGLNPLLLAPLALLGAAGGGGGGGEEGAADTTAPVIKSAKLHVDDDTGAKDNVTSDKTPRITGETDPKANVSVEVNGKTYTGTADANGLFVIQVPDADALKDGTYTVKVTATDAANNKSAVFDGTPFKVDTSADKNEPDTDPNASSVIDIVNITVDSGQNKADFYTNDNQLVFNGTLKNFTDNGDWVKLELRDLSNKLIDTTYVKPVPNGSGWDWSWDRTTQGKLLDGQYSLFAVVVDGADNVVGTANSRVSDVQTITIDTDKNNNFGPDKSEDPNRSSTIEISTLSQDTGYSNLDFITKDRTHVYSGKLSAFTENGASVELTLKNSDGKVIAAEYVASKPIDGVWTWTWDQTANELQDGEYILQASLVDKAGNAIQVDTQVISVDNNAGENGGKVDPNASLKMLPVTFADDTGLSQTDYLTNDQFLTFKGGFDKNFVDNGDRVLVQVFGANGLVISSQYVLPSGKSWEFENLTRLGSDNKTNSYTVKSVLVDAAGNTLQATDQSFVIDREIFINQKSKLTQATGLWTFNEINYSAAEVGVYSFNKIDGIKVTKTYTGGLFDLKDLEGKIFEIGTFSLAFTDQAGNTYTIKNDNERMDFSNAKMSTETTTTAVFPPPGFGDNQLVGSIGKLSLTTASAKELDMASLYDGISDLGDVAAINHVDLTQGDHTLTLTMGDVLELGVKNSFSNASAHKGHLQMRIDGDANDKVVLDDLLGTTDYNWNTNNSNVTLDGQNYLVYTHEGLGLSLFVNNAMAQQITLV